MRRRPGSFSVSRPRRGRWLRRLALAAAVLVLLFLLYGGAVQRMVYSARGTMIFLPALAGR